jgi:peptidoglycan/xylan/chitin deacetylase (PgdA/CDA1 family)
MKKIIVTTSWDDGHRLDIKLAKLLRKYNIKGTFYISPQDREFRKDDLLTNQEIKEISKNFEIGAHTMTHPRLNTISVDTAKIEIRESKIYLEKIIRKPVISFCYPGGSYNSTNIEQAKKAGFKLARTVKQFASNESFDPFEMPTTVHAYHHWSNILPIFKYSEPTHFLKNYFDWECLAKTLFDRIEENGGIFHLWGHSWEIEKFHYWNKLEIILQHISNKKNVSYISNGELYD